MSRWDRLGGFCRRLAVSKVRQAPNAVLASQVGASSEQSDRSTPINDWKPCPRPTILGNRAPQGQRRTRAHGGSGEDPPGEPRNEGLGLMASNPLFIKEIPRMTRRPAATRSPGTCL